MFYSFEDVEVSYNLAEALFGANGRIDPDAIHQNIAIMTDAFGKIWYGDTDSYEPLHTLSEALGVSCKIIGADGYSPPLYMAEPKS